MGDRRRSERLKRNAGLRSGAKQPKDKRTPKPRTRDSVGGVLGLTPNRSAGRNLQVARAADAAVAAAARLEQLEVAARSAHKGREGKKATYIGLDRARTDYSPKLRNSLAMYAVTNGVLDDEEDDDEDDDAVNADMPPLDGDSDDELEEDADSPDEKENRDDALSIIATPGPVEEPDTDDRAFIKRSSESDSGHNTEDALRGDDDLDYMSGESQSMDDDEDEDDDEDQPKRRHVTVAEAKAEAERAARAAYNAALQQVRTQQEEIQRLAMEAADRRFAEHIAKLQQDKLEEVAESDDEKPADDEDDYYEDGDGYEHNKKEKKKLSKKEKKELKKQKKKERKERHKKKRKEKRDKKKQKRKERKEKRKKRKTPKGRGPKQ